MQPVPRAGETALLVSSIRLLSDILTNEFIVLIDCQINGWIDGLSNGQRAEQMD